MGGRNGGGMQRLAEGCGGAVAEKICLDRELETHVTIGVRDAVGGPGIFLR